MCNHFTSKKNNVAYSDLGGCGDLCENTDMIPPDNICDDNEHEDEEKEDEEEEKEVYNGWW